MTGVHDVRWLIVNADDFGASSGINAGIVRAYDEGIVTSTSLMVTMPATEEAARMASTRPDLSVGVHVDLSGEGTPAPADVEDPEACRSEIAAQLSRFEELVGAPPTHLDVHHNLHRLAHLAPLFRDAAAQLAIPLRESSEVRYFPDFYGQWDDGESHLEWISVENLLSMLDNHIGSGVTELSCHPGFVDPHFDSPYHREREAELATLCHPAVREHIERSRIILISYRDLTDSQG